MNASKRIFVNTVAQYMKAVVNTCLSLYTVRIILEALGKSDYGIFSLVAGVVAMLAFLTNAMSIATQRHLSYNYGRNDKNKVRQMFSNSVLIHFVFATLLAVVLLSLKSFLFEDYLNIADDRRETAAYVYIITVGVMFLTFTSAPFKALFIARENIVFIAAIEVLDGVLKLALALTVLRIDADKLLLYGWMVLFIQIVQYLAFTLYSLVRFEECKPRMFLKDYNLEHVKDLLGFASWTTYGMGSIIVRNQGLAVIFNRTFGTVMNAAYGIGLQLYSAVTFVSSSVVNAMNPQIMKAEGAGDRNRMLTLAMRESKYVTALMLVLFIPLCFEMDNVLTAWLGASNIPDYSSMFCRCMLLAFIADQTTYGLNTANQAIGQIRNYTLLMYTPKLLFILLAYLLVQLHCQIETIMYTFVAMELIMAMIRIPYIHLTAGMSVSVFIKSVLWRLFPLVVTVTTCSCILINITEHSFRFLFSIPISATFGLIIIWFAVLDIDERHLLIQIVLSRKNKAYKNV